RSKEVPNPDSTNCYKLAEIFQINIREKANNLGFGVHAHDMTVPVQVPKSMFMLIEDENPYILYLKQKVLTRFFPANYMKVKNGPVRNSKRQLSENDLRGILNVVNKDIKHYSLKYLLRDVFIHQHSGQWTVTISCHDVVEDMNRPRVKAKIQVLICRACIILFKFVVKDEFDIEITEVKKEIKRFNSEGIDIGFKARFIFCLHLANLLIWVFGKQIILVTGNYFICDSFRPLLSSFGRKSSDFFYCECLCSILTLCLIRLTVTFNQIKRSKDVSNPESTNCYKLAEIFQINIREKANNLGFGVHAHDMTVPVQLPKSMFMLIEDENPYILYLKQKVLTRFFPANYMKVKNGPVRNSKRQLSENVPKRNTKRT
ncbi:hypothetical protein ROZALSC1DRAFT_24990, partial [Rozella allomycis CSF55]